MHEYNKLFKIFINFITYKLKTIQAFMLSLILNEAFKALNLIDKLIKILVDFLYLLETSLLFEFHRLSLCNVNHFFWESHHPCYINAKTSLSFPILKFVEKLNFTSDLVKKSLHEAKSNFFIESKILNKHVVMCCKECSTLYIIRKVLDHRISYCCSIKC